MTTIDLTNGWLLDLRDEGDPRLNRYGTCYDGTLAELAALAYQVGRRAGIAEVGASFAVTLDLHRERLDGTRRLMEREMAKLQTDLRERKDRWERWWKR